MTTTNIKNNELYLIDKQTYIQHMKNQMLMCGAVDALVDAIKDLPSNRGCKALCDYAELSSKICHGLTEPLVEPFLKARGDLEKMAGYMLPTPEEAGFFYLDDEDEDDEDEYEDDRDEIRDDEAEYVAANALMDTLIEALVHVARDVFGEDVIININVDD